MLHDTMEFGEIFKSYQPFPTDEKTTNGFKVFFAFIEFCKNNVTVF